jgi:hypothetical protein
MKQRLIIKEQLTFDELHKAIEYGGKFVTFQYCISIVFAVTLRRFSPAIFIRNHEELLRYKRKYDLLSLVFGWWGIPWGPVYTIRSLRINRKGGLDITEDIMLNLTDENFRQNEVELIKAGNLFSKPDKWDKKAFVKAISKQFERDYNVKQIVVGLFINTEEGVPAHYTIGLRVDKDFEKHTENVREALYTQFRKHAYFEFLNLNEEEEIIRRLQEQGEYIINRTNTI